MFRHSVFRANLAHRSLGLHFCPEKREALKAFVHELDTRRYNVYIRILIMGDRFWACHQLAASIIRRLVARYGPDIVIVHGDSTGVDESFAAAAKGQGVAVEAHPADCGNPGKSGVSSSFLLEKMNLYRITPREKTN